MDDLVDLDWKQPPVASNSRPSKPTVSQHKDAFADLFNLPSKDNEPDLSRLSLAEQQRRQHSTPVALKQRPPTSSSIGSSPQARSGSPVSRLTPSLATSAGTHPSHQPTSLPASNASTSHQGTDDAFDDLLSSFGMPVKRKENLRNIPLNALQSQSNTPPPAAAGAPQQWNFDLLDSPESSTPPTKKSAARETSESPIFDPFDMDTLSMKTAPPSNEPSTDQEDNPLGILSQPMASSPVPSPSPSSSVQNQESRSHRASPTLSNTVPSMDEVHQDPLAQLVNMGFAPEAASIALEVTGGEDLQAAIDLLVQNAEAKKQNKAKKDTSRQPATAQSPVGNSSPEIGRPRWDEQAQQQKERLVAQATELGGYLYQKSSLFMKTSKLKITKAMEEWQEQQKSVSDRPSRPKWMTDAPEDLEEGPTMGKFVDSDESDDEKGSTSRQEQQRNAQKHQQAQTQAQAQKLRQQERQQRQQHAEKERGSDGYVSPARRNRTPKEKSPATAAPTQTTAKPPPQPTKKQRTRPIVPASKESIQDADHHRLKGNEHFKLGSFGEAEASYSQAIDALPAMHDHIAVLSNNRAASRLKTGDYKKCLEDCALVIKMARTAGDESITPEGLLIHWPEQLKKALQRKATALEHLEKFDQALTTYEELHFEGMSTPQTSQALARCRKALSPPSSTPSSKPPKPSPSPVAPQTPVSVVDLFDPTATSSSPTPSDLSNSKAVAAMRATAARQEAEEVERLAKTDEVNARLLLWKQGKEQNLRALLSTLDTLLWPGAEWRGTAMSELIDPKKCKIVYMKAISKVHPDKLPLTVTVEQRMVANGIFSTLNEAWDAFKSQQ